MPGGVSQNRQGEEEADPGLEEGKTDRQTGAEQRHDYEAELDAHDVERCDY